MSKSKKKYKDKRTYAERKAYLQKYLRDYMRRKREKHPEPLIQPMPESAQEVVAIEFCRWSAEQQSYLDPDTGEWDDDLLKYA